MKMQVQDTEGDVREKTFGKFAGRKERLRAALILLFTFLLAGSLYIVDKNYTELSDGGKLKRNEYGEGARTEELYVWMNGEKEEIEVQIPPRLYRKDEMRALWKEAEEKLDHYILGGIRQRMR